MEPLDIHIQQKKKANRITLAHTAIAAGLGFAPFPLLDAASILGIQVWMLGRLARTYDLPFKKNLAKSIIGTLVGNIGSIGAVKLIPGLGSVLGGGMVAVSAGAATYGLGKLFTQHFSQGGTLLSFDPVKSQEYFRQLYEEGKATVKELKAQQDDFEEVHNQALASTSALKQANEELKATIASLQNQLEQSKKDRKYAVAALQEKKRRRLGWFWLLLFLIAMTFGLGGLYRAGYLNNRIFSNRVSKESMEGAAIAGPEAAEQGKTNVDTQAGAGADTTAATAVAPDTSAAILAGPTAAEMNFTPGSTEAVMADYLSAVDASFPKSFTLEKAQYEEGIVTLAPEAEQQIANIATLLENYPAATFRIFGHIDQMGGKAANQQAGRNRARLIQEILKQNGVERRRISATYLEKPAPPDGKRRAEIEVEKRE
ncbi:MAG: OmpA family protein [Lewinellaceae bacterium]|nr:OmpA family protein [Phaeodactylibacter sp.]MCB9348846.1 OmpA family protein [Lewinellaceae bacterium]